MSVARCTFDEFINEVLDNAVAGWSAVAMPPVTIVVVDFAGVSKDRHAELQKRLGSRNKHARSSPMMPPCPVVGINLPTNSSSTDTSSTNTPLTDDQLPAIAREIIDCTVPDDARLGVLCERVSANPLASAVLVQLVRQSLELTSGQALFAESLAYSTLQHCREFEAYLEAREPRRRSSSFEEVDKEAVPEVVRIDRAGAQLRVTLNQPARRNAFSSAMRDQLCEALELAQLDTTIECVVLGGAGDAFCAGGDLDEFGAARDAGIAHLSRSTLSAGAMIAAIADRVEVQVHGACIGAGIELPAFAGKICAKDNSFFQLPEVGLGLVPGAGGTASLPRRIGRHRTAWLALSGERINAATALDWGLVDELVS